MKEELRSEDHAVIANPALVLRASVVECGAAAPLSPGERTGMDAMDGMD